ncbi:MAG: hypothetical protein EXS47_00365 [Candidatus Zambryskibacteria bacterium]|nr:hypothetical protein [Candidatus Zambryskibacteria bacterium]
MELPSFGMPNFPSISLSFFINTTGLIVVLALFSIVYVVITSVLVYHWSAYGMRNPGILVAETLFLFVSLVLFVFAGLAISYY